MIYGNHLRLRGIEREDIPTFIRWFNDPEVREGLLAFAPMSTADEERWFEGRQGRTDDYLFGIEVQEADQEPWVHIGNIGLHHIDWRSRNTTFGIVIGEKAYWNHGWGTEATRTVLRFAFEELNLHRVELEVFDFNQRAIRAYEKAGFRREGTRRQHHFLHGAYHDAHIMSMLENEFQR